MPSRRRGPRFGGKVISFVALEWACCTLIRGWIPNPNGLVPGARDDMTAIRWVGNREGFCVTVE